MVAHLFQTKILFFFIHNTLNSTFGVPKVEKFEIRISKSETNPNFLMIK